MRLEIVFKDGNKKVFNSVESFKVTEENRVEYSVAQIPTEGKLFKVNPLEMGISKFENPMSDSRQELTRQIILKAFDEVERWPEKYAMPFSTLIPEKTWNGCKTVSELREYAVYLGGYMADWVEQALEWAQRISNGETWQSICNDGDTAKCHRIINRNGFFCGIVGGSNGPINPKPATNISNYDIFGRDSEFYKTVPLVVFKET